MGDVEGVLFSDASARPPKKDRRKQKLSGGFLSFQDCDSLRTRQSKLQASWTLLCWKHSNKGHAHGDRGKWKRDERQSRFRFPCSGCQLSQVKQTQLAAVLCQCRKRRHRQKTRRSGSTAVLSAGLEADFDVDIGTQVLVKLGPPLSQRRVSRKLMSLSMVRLAGNLEAT